MEHCTLKDTRSPSLHTRTANNEVFVLQRVGILVRLRFWQALTHFYFSFTFNSLRKLLRNERKDAPSGARFSTVSSMIYRGRESRRDPRPLLWRSRAWAAHAHNICVHVLERTKLKYKVQICHGSTIHACTMADGHDAESLRPPELKRQKLMSKEETASLRKEYIA